MRRHQDGLVSIGHRDQQGINSHGGLARADVGLQEPLHRPIARQVPANFARRLILIRGEPKRKEPANPRIDRWGERKRGGVLAIAQLPAAQGQGELKDEKFLVHEAAPAGTSSGERFGSVDLSQSLWCVGKTMPFPELGGEYILDLAAVKRNRLPDDGPELLRTKILGQRVNRHHRRGTGFDRAVQDLHARVGHLPVIPMPLRLAAEGQALAVAKRPGGVGLVEPDSFEAMQAFAEHHADDAPAIRQVASGDLYHLPVHRLHAIGT